MRNHLGACFAVAVIGCAPTPIAPPAPRAGTAASASSGKAWDAAIELFSDRNISIKTIDRSSGLIVAEAQKVNSRDTGLADCGKTMGMALAPTDATWNLLIRGDSSRSTIKASVRFVRVGTARGISTETVAEECSSYGTWESAFESQVKARAEAKK